MISLSRSPISFSYLTISRQSPIKRNLHAIATKMAAPARENFSLAENTRRRPNGFTDVATMIVLGNRRSFERSFQAEQNESSVSFSHGSFSFKVVLQGRAVLCVRM